MTIEDEIAQAAAECDARFHRGQPALIAGLRALGVRDAEMPEVLAFACDEYERQRAILLDRTRTLLERLAVAEARRPR